MNLLLKYLTVIALSIAAAYCIVMNNNAMVETKKWVYATIFIYGVAVISKSIFSGKYWFNQN